MGDDFKDILKFWRAVELFNLPDVPVSKKKKQFSDLIPGEDLPWEPGVLPSSKEGKQWRHTLYFHVTGKQEVAALLSRLSDSKEFREPVGGDTCLSALVVDHQGRPAERTYSPAAFLYGMKIIREKLDYEELPGFLRKAGEESLKRWQAEGEMIDWRMLQKELGLLREVAGNDLPAHTPLRCISEQVDQRANAEAPFLNSYYLKDLNGLINSSEDAGLPLKTFLSVGVDLSARTNLLQQRVLLEKLHPRHQSPARWPSSPLIGLYSAQQAALNITLLGLRDDSGLLGINGPPGTGKTTLLREIVADVVVRRAQRILKAGAQNLFDKKWNTLDGPIGYYAINAGVFGNDGIVVASNNNAAVENISKELPVANSVDRGSFGRADYFSHIASLIQEEPCWGMVSAALGRSDNRRAFIGKFWFGKEYNFRKFLKEKCQDPDAMRENEREYEKAARELAAQIEEYTRFQQLAGEYHDLLELLLVEGSDPGWDRLGSLSGRLVADFEVARECLPGKGFLTLSVEEIHRLTPYSSEKINLLRGEIFLQSLKLTELAIRVNARYFTANLNAFVNLSPNKAIPGMDEGVASGLWSCFFFCIPVVSVTLASFQPQFFNMGKGSVGWVLIDEAGQATLPSVCGAIWRAKRCVVIGDTLQIPPVVTIPRGLGRMLQEAYVVGEEWSPLIHSAQYLADRVTPYGTYVGEGIWTGVPLRAHRRCSEPMFSIANEIAYNGQMVKVKEERVRQYPTGESGWIDVLPMTVSGHAVTEELQVAEDLIRMLVGFGGKVFVITPFRSVVEACGGRLKQLYGVDCGTIHRFQGKEAEVVILVLGTGSGAVEARNWVAESPNMLNVAVTRAKERLYVIGNREVWGRHRHFDYLIRVLRKKDHQSGRLF